ncbi:MAG: ADP-ribosylglycohydrolase family protein [Proteobacteria bacterium]|nr:ADP-ribosylglycohydrolase family protein [Pseudomonadota bacterium]
MTEFDRAHGALLGLAIGDALGMPTQYQPRALIAARYGILDRFHPGPDDNFISRGMAAGRVTDDTDQAVLLGEMLVAGRGRIDPEAFAQALLAWEQRMIAAGSADLLGPSTRHALTLVASGTSTEVTGRSGATNGAAMRVAPVGIAFAPQPLSRLVDAVFQTGHVTHNTTIAIAGASAVAAAVSAGVGGATLPEALRLSVEAARLGAERGFYFAGGEVAARIEWALGLVLDQPEEAALDLIYRLVGTGVATNEAVPAAIAVCAVAPDDPWRVCCLAASLGGDCDTVAAIAGAIMGACHGAARFPSDAVAALEAANPGLRLAPLARDLLALRAG